jgi:hypothetical protein
MREMLGLGSIQKRLPAVLLLLCVFATIVRIIPVDQTMPQGFDEPCHIAAGIKWLDQHDYTLDAVHPPLARDAIALPLYLNGVRFPKIAAERQNGQSYCTEAGNAILSDGSHYSRNLFLARIGMLPFLCLAAALVFLWAKQEFGAVSGCVATLLFLSLPSVLAFSSLAYTDLPAMCTQFACLFAFAVWLKNPRKLHTILLGISAGLAFSSKLTSFLFLPVACAAMLLVKVWVNRSRPRDFKWTEALRLSAAICIGVFILWGSYSFSVGHIQDALGISEPTKSAPDFLRKPGSSIQKLILADPAIPAPDFLRGVVRARTMNKEEPESYLLGRTKRGGWWYFFPLALALKTPLTFLILAVIGLLYSLRAGSKGEWPMLMPAAAVAGVFVATMFVSLRVGTRHVLVILPLLALLAGYGAARLWSTPRRALGRITVCLLLAWQSVASVRAQSDFLAYFNELAPTDPGSVLVKGCDLDCGQDIFRLSQELRARGVTHFGIGICTSANVALIDLPPFSILPAHEPVAGWVAVSLRALKTGQFKIIQNDSVSPHEGYPDDALAWLERYRPVVKVGKTILLYDIPETGLEKASPSQTITSKASIR